MKSQPGAPLQLKEIPRISKQTRLHSAPRKEKKKKIMMSKG